MNFLMSRAEENSLQSRKRCFKNAWNSTKKLYGCFLSGMVFAALINEIIKTLVAEPRPHFMDTCKPKSLNCSKPNQ